MTQLSVAPKDKIKIIGILIRRGNKDSSHGRKEVDASLPERRWHDDCEENCNRRASAGRRNPCVAFSLRETEKRAYFFAKYRAKLAGAAAKRRDTGECPLVFCAHGISGLTLVKKWT
jgi:hypothetical protein